MLFLAVSALPVTVAFQSPLPMTAAIQIPPTFLHSLLLPYNNEHQSSLFQATYGATEAIGLVSQHHATVWIADGGTVDTIRNIAAGVTAFLFLLAGLTYAYASIIIPAAAKELEKECKELDPQLWTQYSAKLGEGETMASRPDLMQELGTKLQPLIEAKLKALDEAGLPTPLETTLNPFSKSSVSSNKNESEFPSIPTSSSQWDSNDGIIDAVLADKESNDADKKVDK